MTQPVINGVTAMIPSHLEKSVYFSGCAELISMLGVCDGIPDCSTGEDELNCTHSEGLIMRLRGRQPTILVSDQARHKLGCKAIEAIYKPEISDLKRRDIILSMWRKQGADQLVCAMLSHNYADCWSSDAMAEI